MKGPSLFDRIKPERERIRVRVSLPETAIREHEQKRRARVPLPDDDLPAIMQEDYQPEDDVSVAIYGANWREPMPTWAAASDDVKAFVRRQARAAKKVMGK